MTLARGNNDGDGWQARCSAALLLSGFTREFLPRGSAPPLLTVSAKMSDIEQTVLASGTLQPLKLVSVGAQASGRIVKMYVALGDHVAEGQLLAEIDPATQRNALQNAEALLAQERAQRTSRAVALRLAELAFKRAAATFSQEASSQADYETAEATFRGAKAGRGGARCSDSASRHRG